MPTGRSETAEIILIVIIFDQGMAVSTYRNIIRRSHPDQDNNQTDLKSNNRSIPMPNMMSKPATISKQGPQSRASPPSRLTPKLPPKLTNIIKPGFKSISNESSETPVLPPKNLAQENRPEFESNATSTNISTSTPPSSENGTNSAPRPSSPPVSVPAPTRLSSATTPQQTHQGMNVVILGGSFSGLSVAVTLAKSPPRDITHITLVEPKSYLEVRWATIRSLFDDSVCETNTVSLAKILSSHSMITHVRACATSIGMDTVQLDDGRHLPYDVLLVATGAIHAFSVLTPQLSPGTLLSPSDALKERRSYLRKTGDSILAARSVLVIGGGPVGTELAADIASFSQQRGSDVRVTLVDSNDKLMPGYPRSIAQKLRDKLANLRVKVILGHHAVAAGNGVWELRGNGKRLEADIVLTTTGVTPCAGNIFGEGSESVRDGWVRTDRFGRVIGCRGDVFAAGDCCDWSAKSGENTLANRNAYAHNIRLTVEAIANNRALASIDSRLKRVSVSHRPPAVVASTPREGEATSPFAALSPSWWWMKNRGMLLAKAQKEIGW